MWANVLSITGFAITNEPKRCSYTTRCSKTFLVYYHLSCFLTFHLSFFFYQSPSVLVILLVKELCHAYKYPTVHKADCSWFPDKPLQHIPSIIYLVISSHTFKKKHTYKKKSSTWWHQKQQVCKTVPSQSPLPFTYLILYSTN